MAPEKASRKAKNLNGVPAKKVTIIEAPATKKTKKQSKNEVSYRVEPDSEEDSQNYTEGMTFERLTNKKKEYLQEHIEDRNGTFTYLQDPEEYKRARK